MSPSGRYGTGEEQRNSSRRMKRLGQSEIDTELWMCPFKYDLNQIPYEYTVDVTKGFKALDLVDRVPKELQIGGNDQNHPQEKEARRQNGCLRRLYE